MNNILQFRKKRIQAMSIREFVTHEFEKEELLDRFVQSELNAIFRLVMMKLAFVVIAYVSFFLLLFNGTQLYSLNGFIVAILASIITLLVCLVILDAFTLTQIRKRNLKLL